MSWKREQTDEGGVSIEASEARVDAGTPTEPSDREDVESNMIRIGFLEAALEHYTELYEVD
jgi:hypothetical protein